MKLNKLIGVIMITAAIILISGCIPTIKMNPAASKNIRNIYVSEKVQTPSTMVFMSPQSGYLSGLGIVGGIVGAASDNEVVKKLNQEVEQHGIRISNIVRQEMIKQLGFSQRYKLVSTPTAADAVLFLNVKLYGIMIPHGFSNQLKPNLTVDASLVDKSNHVIWENHAACYPFTDGTPAHKLKEFQQNPNLFYQAWDAAAKIVARKLMQLLTMAGG